VSEISVYKVLAGKHGHPDSTRYQRLLEYLMTPQQAEIVAMLPSDSDEVAAKLGVEVATVNLELERLFHKGVVLPENFQTLEGCHFPEESFRFKDYTTMGSWRSAPSVDKKFFELWEDFAREEWFPNNAMIYPNLKQPLIRIIPAYNSILDSPQILPYEDIREIIKVMPSIAVVACPCRQLREAIGGKCKHSYDAACIHFGYGADYIVNRGFGDKLSLQEALQLIDEAEEDGLMHIWLNSASMAHNVICNCCDDCCVVFEPLASFQVPPSKLCAKSRYEASVEQDICDGCQVCIDRCPFEAIDMVKMAGSKKLKALVNAEKCMGCGVCVVGCEPKALTMKLVRPIEHIPL